MQRLLATGVALVALTTGAACSGDDGTESVEALRTRAATLTDLLASNDWSAVREDFDTTMSERLTEARLDAAWTQVTQRVGSYRSRSEPTRVPKPGDLTVFDTPMQFARGDMKSRITFAADGQVAGLFVLVPSAA